VGVVGPAGKEVFAGSFEHMSPNREQFIQIPGRSSHLTYPHQFLPLLPVWGEKLFVLDRLHNLFVIVERVLLVVVCRSSQGDVVLPALARYPTMPLFFDFLTLCLTRGGGPENEMRIIYSANGGHWLQAAAIGRVFFGGFLLRFNRDEAGAFHFSLSRTRQGCHYGHV
jgi:hypothetical protein